MAGEGLTCPKCHGPAVRVLQTGGLSCVNQCDETLHDELVRKELEGLTASLARLVGAHTPNGYVFAIVLSKTGRKGCTAYASNGQREDMRSMLKELLDKMLVTHGRAS